MLILESGKPQGSTLKENSMGLFLQQIKHKLWYHTVPITKIGNTWIFTEQKPTFRSIDAKSIHRSLYHIKTDVNRSIAIDVWGSVKLTVFFVQ